MEEREGGGSESESAARRRRLAALACSSAACRLRAVARWRGGLPEWGGSRRKAEAGGRRMRCGDEYVPTLSWEQSSNILRRSSRSDSC